MSRYPQFDRQRLELKSLAERGHDLVWTDCWPLEPPHEPFEHPEFPELVARIIAARRVDRPVVLMMGAHPIKLGLSRFLIHLIDGGFITHVATMARNVARQDGREIRHFTTAVFDLVPLPPNFRDGTPSKSDPGYYYRPWKTILVRTVADGGQSCYFCGDHRQTIPTLLHELTRSASSNSIGVVEAQDRPPQIS